MDILAAVSRGKRGRRSLAVGLPPRHPAMPRHRPPPALSLPFPHTHTCLPPARPHLLEQLGDDLLEALHDQRVWGLGTLAGQHGHGPVGHHVQLGTHAGSPRRRGLAAWDPAQGGGEGQQGTLRPEHRELTLWVRGWARPPPGGSPLGAQESHAFPNSLRTRGQPLSCSVSALPRRKG